MFGLPFLLTPYITGHYMEGEEAARKYLEVIGRTLEGLRKRGYLPQTSPLDTKAHDINPGDWVLIKSWKNRPLMPKFEGSFQVLLIANSAVRTREKGWTHIMRIKGPVPPPGIGQDSSVSPSGIGPDSTPPSHPNSGQDSTTSGVNSAEYTIIKGPYDLKLTLKKKNQKD